MSETNIYICGDESEVSEKDFVDTQKLKQQLYKMKCNVITPNQNSFQEMNWSDRLQERIEQIKNSKVIYVLPNWRNNVMNRIELTVALDMKLHALYHPVDIMELKRILKESG